MGLVASLLSSDVGLAAGDSAGMATARALFEANQLGEARVAFEKLSVATPKDPEVNFYLGVLALRRFEPEKSVAYLQKAVAAAPGTSRYHQWLGEAYGRSAQRALLFSQFGLARKCLAEYQRAVELDPRNLDARFNLFDFYRSAPAIIGGGAERAAAEAAAIKKLSPDRGRIAFAILLVLQKQYERARAELDEVPPLDLAAVRGDRVFLSDVQWSAATVGWGQPARNHYWFDEKINQHVSLRLCGRMHDKGLYAHSPSHYVFALDGKWTNFSAIVGLRDEAHQQGSAIFTVRGDGREIFRSAMLRVGALERVNVNVTGVNELELVAEGGEGHNHNSWAIWAEPVVSR